MKILAVSHYFPPHIGGIENITENQVKYLANCGNEISVLSSAIDHKKGATKYTEGYVVYRVPAWNIFEKLLGAPFPLYAPSLIAQAFKLVRNADVVQVHDVYYFSSWAAAFWAHVLRKPLVVSQHVSLVDHHIKLIVKAQKFTHRTVGKLLFKAANNVIVYNINDQKFLVDLGVASSKIVRVQNSIDTEYYSPISNKQKSVLRAKYDLPDSKPIILYAGRLVPKKGYKIVLHANSKSYTTLIAGGGIVSDTDKNESDVIFFGPASKDQLLDLYRLSDVFVFPTIGEIFTLVIMEAMSCGLPTITTDDAGYRLYDLNRELIGFTKRDSKNVKNMINKIVFDENLKANMAIYSRALSLDKFDYKQNYAKELDIFTSLVKAA